MMDLNRKINELYTDVYYFVLSKLYDEDVARDVTQNVMERIILNIETLKSEKSFKPWAMRITVNEINMYFRNLKRYNKTFASVENIEEFCETQEINIEDLEADILECLLNKEAGLNVMRALDSLDEKYREVIRLNIICEYKLIEIADILNVNVNTVRTRYVRGLVKLKEAFVNIERG